MPRPKKVIEKKSPDPVKSEETPKGDAEGKLELKSYNGIEITRVINENATAYHIQLANGTSTWVPKDAVK